MIQIATMIQRPGDPKIRSPAFGTTAAEGPQCAGRI